jgi:hypothetical protein
MSAGRRAGRRKQLKRGKRNSGEKRSLRHVERLRRNRQQQKHPRSKAPGYEELKKKGTQATCEGLASVLMWPGYDVVARQLTKDRWFYERSS